MSFAGDHLVLGAGTCLAKLGKRSLRELSIEGQEERILTLLSVAYWRPISIEALKSIRAAVRAYSCGERVLAHIHLAHTGLPSTECTSVDREFCRLFLADRLLSAGVTPLRLLDGLGIDAAAIRSVKAGPDDPKHPGWPTGTSGGRGGKFRPRSRDGAPIGVLGPTPVVDFSGGFHDVVVKAWVDYFQKNGIPVVTKPGLRFICESWELPPPQFEP
jgi:hypothetical protein